MVWMCRKGWAEALQVKSMRWKPSRHFMLKGKPLFFFTILLLLCIDTYFLLDSAVNVGLFQQSYGEQTSTGGSAYSSTLSTSAPVSSSTTSNSTGPAAALSATLNSGSTHPVQPSKASVPGSWFYSVPNILMVHDVCVCVYLLLT